MENTNLNNENIKHNNILLSSNQKEQSNTIEQNSMKQFDDIVRLQNKHKLINSKKSWSKLDKITKIKKLQEFCKKYSEENKLSKEKTDILQTYLRDCLDRKKLHRIKDVIYDKETHSIVNIPALSFNSVSQRFTLKSDDKSGNSLKNLTRVKKKTTKQTIKPKKTTTNKNSNKSNSQVKSKSSSTTNSKKSSKEKELEK